MSSSPRSSVAFGRFLAALCAAVALIVGAGACDSLKVKVPDQGIIVTGCQQPSYCYTTQCDCTRASVQPPSGACVRPLACTSPVDRSTCSCPAATACMETSRACVGRGVLCEGANAHCVAADVSCSQLGSPPMLVPATGTPKLEPHCQFVDDVCCTTPPTDGGAHD